MRGDVYWVDLHGDGTAVRPYLVLQSDALNDVASSTIAVPLTLAPQTAGTPLTIELCPGESGLDEPTWIRGHQTPKTADRSRPHRSRPTAVHRRRTTKRLAI